MTQSQKEFEAWADGKYILHKSSINGKYMTVLTNHAWEAWKESRAALVVELPSLIIDEYENGDTIEYVEMTDLKESFDQSGVSYK